MCSKAKFQRNHSIHPSIHHPPKQPPTQTSRQPMCIQLPTCPVAPARNPPPSFTPRHSATCPLGSVDTATAAEGTTLTLQHLLSVLSVAHLAPCHLTVLRAAAAVCCRKAHLSVSFPFLNAPIAPQCPWGK